jgi:C1A family cysteine protease
VVPGARNQGACGTCVAEATIAAVESAIASTLRMNVSSFNLSAPAFYYCSPGGKTCNSGWDLGRSLELVSWSMPKQIGDGGEEWM